MFNRSQRDFERSLTEKGFKERSREYQRNYFNEKRKDKRSHLVPSYYSDINFYKLDTPYSVYEAMQYLISQFDFLDNYPRLKLYYDIFIEELSKDEYDMDVVLYLSQKLMTELRSRRIMVLAKDIYNITKEHWYYCSIKNIIVKK